MKIKTDKPQPAFEPRSITFTFESQEELDAMFKLFNWTPVTELNSSFERVWEKLETLGVSTVLTAQEEILRHPSIRGEIIELADEYTKK